MKSCVGWQAVLFYPDMLSFRHLKNASGRDSKFVRDKLKSGHHNHVLISGEDEPYLISNNSLSYELQLTCRTKSKNNTKHSRANVPFYSYRKVWRVPFLLLFSWHKTHFSLRSYILHLQEHRLLDYGQRVDVQRCNDNTVVNTSLRLTDRKIVMFVDITFTFLQLSWSYIVINCIILLVNNTVHYKQPNNKFL